MRRILSAAVVLAVAAGGPAWAADAEAGARVFRTQCGACHVVEEGKNRVGPSMFGIFGRKSGQVEGFKYSAANKAADLTWDAETLETYLTNPRAVVPGTTMTFVGVKNPTQRADLIAYLQTIK